MRSLIFTKIATTLLGAALVTSLTGTAALAGSSPVVGNFTFTDLGQGGHVGGALLADGSVTGGGAISLFNGEFIAKITGGNWSSAGPGEIRLCLDHTTIKPSGESGENCFDLPINGMPQQVQLPGSFGGGTSVIRVLLR